jgi:hypothetical protein
VGCFNSSIGQGHISGLLDWLCKTTIKRKFRISRKRKLLFPHLFCQKSLFHFRFHFRQKNSVSVSVPQISIFISIFSFCFRFSAEKSESFRSTFIPSCRLVQDLNRLGHKNNNCTDKAFFVMTNIRHNQIDQNKVTLPSNIKDYLC